MEVFGTQHLIYFIVAIVLMIALTVIFKIFIPKDKMFIVMKVIASISLILIVIYRIVVSKSRSSSFIDFLPDTFCSMMGFILPIVVLIFKPNTKIFQYAMFSGMIGGILTLVYPDFLVYFDSILNIHPFTGMLYHTLMLFMFILSIVTGYFKPTFKNWVALPIGLAFMVVAGEFGNTVLGQTNNMYLNSPLIKDTVFTWWFVGILFILLYTIIIQIYEMITLPPKEWSIVKVTKKFKKSKNETGIKE